MSKSKPHEDWGKPISSFSGCWFPEFLFNSNNKGLHPEVIYWGQTPEWFKYWTRLKSARRKGSKLQGLPLSGYFPVPAGAMTDSPVLLVTTTCLLLLSQDLTLPPTTSRQGPCFISLVPTPHRYSRLPPTGCYNDRKLCQLRVSNYTVSPSTAWQQKALCNCTLEH